MKGNLFLGIRAKRNRPPQLFFTMKPVAGPKLLTPEAGAGEADRWEGEEEADCQEEGEEVGRQEEAGEEGCRKPSEACPEGEGEQPCQEDRRILRILRTRKQLAHQEAPVAAKVQHQGQHQGRCPAQRIQLGLHSRNRHPGSAEQQPKEGQRRSRRRGIRSRHRGIRSRRGGCHGLSAAREPRHRPAGRAARASHHHRQGSHPARDRPQYDEADIRREHHQTARS